MHAVVVADDLTGSLDAGAALLSAHVDGRCVAVPWTTTLEEVLGTVIARSAPDLLCVNTDTRNATAQEAHDRVARVMRWLIPRPARRFKKVDSLLRGQVAAELDAFLRTEDGMRRPALFAPALPGQGRSTVNGVQLAHGLPVDVSPVAEDPLAPPMTSTLSDLVPAGLPVVHLSVADVRSGSLISTLARCAKPGSVVIADATNETDMSLLYRAAETIPQLSIIGTSGFRPSPSRAAASLVRSVGEPLLILGASRNPVFAAQREVLRSRRKDALLISIDPGGTDARDPRGASISLGLHGARTAVVYVDPEGTPDDNPDGRSRVARGMVAGLAQIAHEFLMERAGPHVLVIIGGDLGQAVCERSAITSLHVLGTVEDGAVVCTASGVGALVDSRMVFRSGGFGGPDSLLAMCTV